MEIFYMDKAAGVTPATGHTTEDYPNEGTYPGVQVFQNGSTVTAEAKIVVTAAATNDIIVALPMPALHVPADCMLVSGDIDSGASLTMTVAELNQDFTDIVANTELITASTIGQAGGVARAAVALGLRLPPVSRTRWYGVKIAAGAAGINEGAILSLSLSYRAANAD